MNQDNKGMEDLLRQRMMEVHRFHMRDKIDLLNALENAFGPEVKTIVEKAEGEKAREEWRTIAHQTGKSTIEDLIALLWEPLRQKGFEFSVEEKPDGVQMRCTRCPIFDMAKELGGTDWMYHHTCSVDPYIAEGFNERIKLVRTKTLMQGDPYCDHFYTMK